MLFIVTMGVVSASDGVNNESVATSDVVGASLDNSEVQIANNVNIDEISNIYYTDSIYASGDSGSIDIHVKDAYNSLTKNWTEEGVDLAGADIKVLDSSNNVVFSGKTLSGGIYSVGGLPQGNYKVQLSYSTYEPYTQNVNIKAASSIAINYMFVPDILLLVSYNSHSEKVDYLMNLSRRVAYIDIENFDKTRSWLFEYAKYIQIDMFSPGSYSNFGIAEARELLSKSPANANYNVAYTFGIYNDDTFTNLGIHFVGASANNNTPNTLENTYIGSYFQAPDIDSSEVLAANMENYLKYIFYLINPQKYTNPTLDTANTPRLSPECGIYHPVLGTYTVTPSAELINQWIISNPGYNDDGEGSLNWMLDEYVKWQETELNPTELFREFENDYINRYNTDVPFVAIATYYCGGSVVDALINTYEANGRSAFNVFKLSTAPAMSSILLTLTKSSQLGISAVASLYSWSLNYGNHSALNDLSEMNLTVVKGLFDVSQESYESETGAQAEWTYSVTVPSFEGVFSPIILSYKDSLGKSHVVQSGIDKMVKLTSGWANLKDMDNFDKVVSIVLYNYPAGKAEIGASYLDVFQSTYDLLVHLADAGYDIGMDKSDLPSVDELSTWIVYMGNKGTWAQGELNKYVESNWEMLMEHHQLITQDEFDELVANNINQDLYKQMVDYWGDGLGKVMVYNQTYIVIPGLWFGKIFITFQPSRGWEEVNIVESYHDLTLPPHQQYVTFYKWLDEVANCNVVINLGTHGTLEWLPGRNVGVHEGDWSFELNLIPTIYPYIVSNPGEAMVARDRIGAMMITHMTPAMAISGLYGNYTTLLNYIDHYNEQIKNNVSATADEYKKLILELAPTLGFENLSEGQSFDSWLEDLHNYLDKMQNDFNTYGLHTLGKVLSGEELVEEVITIMTSRTTVYDYILHMLYPNLNDKSYYDDISGNSQYYAQSEVVKQWLRNFVTDLVNGTYTFDELASGYGVTNKSSKLYQSLNYSTTVIDNIRNNNEWNAIMTALSGGYVTPGLFADPAYSDSIPTGHMGRTSDTTKMPTKAAYESAVKVVDALLVNYYEQHGTWPELTALILWGTEILRTEGIGVAEFLYFLGCKPTWNEGDGAVTGVELIPINELTVTLSNGSVVKRPRVDVFASMVTSNTDWIKLMLTAVDLALYSTDDDVSNNFLKKHYAENPMKDRLFGLPGAVLEGTGMSNTIPNTADWNLTSLNEDLAKIYLNRVSYSWTLDENDNIVITKQTDNFKYLLTKTDLITQNFDSSWRLLDSDDYYDWFGGLLNAAKILGGDPDTAFVDIRNKNNYIITTYEEEFELEIRSNLLNPKFVDALLSTQAGWIQWSTKFQNAFGSLYVNNGMKLNSQLGNDMAGTLLKYSGKINSLAAATSFQSSAAFMMYMYFQGKWETSNTELVQELANEIIRNAINYGVACCHHTCKNLDFNMQLIQASSLSASEKAKYADILAQATLTSPLYTDDSGQDNPTNPEDPTNPTDSDNPNANDDNNNQQLVNGTTNDQSASDGSAGGATAVGTDTSINPGNAKSAQDQSQDASQSQDSSSQDSSKGKTGGASVHEISKSSASKSASGQSSTPVVLIVAVICLIAIFVVGYARNKHKDDEDDY